MEKTDQALVHALNLVVALALVVAATLPFWQETAGNTVFAMMALAGAFIALAVAVRTRSYTVGVLALVLMLGFGARLSYVYVTFLWLLTF
ncbi:hypothetical protein A3C89_01985 [Candidatus Kaiserbacteria bacterium RIFCSPHIGHO2_02_FULL_50_50]|uniref:Uncharacterized protein n=1 Tax=Candidatus Kaiserbacteria bacterium RIFCSPHIGHO2_02_FULL_50_50 TaxID=1798492 RepID=A0A1F6DCN7_9BACT|nr:MAG: hypothetical protein A3C89_01985 [Candidatus Kaiserbacteria bacterium RIFCSPHIGHO2_02_FULL_50_50]OGG88784.1 MAG: hypothetical protein A3G62_03740 [Candidatus Kaiserbacteria bacterium RIFCSPLOWO2_12_FULL_50_10]